MASPSLRFDREPRFRIPSTTRPAGLHRGAKDAPTTFVVDEAALSEPVHEIGDSGAGGPDHGSQCVVGDFWKNDRLALLNPNLSQFEQDTRQPPFTVVKNLGAKVFLEFDVAIG